MLSEEASKRPRPRGVQGRSRLGVGEGAEGTAKCEPAITGSSVYEGSLARVRCSSYSSRVM